MVCIIPIKPYPSVIRTDRVSVQGMVLVKMINTRTDLVEV